jgi:malonyl-CoA decarboxylase
MPDEPLIFVEIALTSGIPGNIADLLAADRPALDLRKADTAVFYSISSTQAGLKGVSLGNFLIKQVVEELLHDMPWLKAFVTLSPLPGFARWLKAERDDSSAGLRSLADLDQFAALDEEGWHERNEIRRAMAPVLERAAALYLLRARNASGKPLDPVARFHLGNGARLERINPSADFSARGLGQSHGVMVNYLYDLAAIEKNHEIYAESGEVVCAPAVRKIPLGDAAAASITPIHTLLGAEIRRKRGAAIH